MIESRQACAGRHRDAEFLPQPIAAVLQLLDRRTEHVLEDDQPRVRRDDEALRRNQSMRHIAGVLVQHRDRWNQLPNEAERRVDIELELFFLRYAENVGQPRAFEVIRHDGQGGGRRHGAIDATDACVVRMTEIRQAGCPLAQCELE